MPSPVVELLFHIALTAVVGRSYVRFLRKPGSPEFSTGPWMRPVVLLVGGFLCLSLMLATLNKLTEVFR